VLTMVKEVMLVKKGFDAGREDAYPDFPRGFDKGDRTEVIEGDVVRLFGDGTKQSPFPGRGALSMGP